MMKRKIAVITGSRADYGHLYRVIKNIHRDRDMTLQLIVTGMHLSGKYGRTINEIKKDGIPISGTVDMLYASDTAKAVACSMGRGMAGFADSYAKLSPDILVVLGDRFEIFAAVAAAIPFKIPVAHISGGESTEGVMDEQFRHAITKMSHIHFPSTVEYRRRIVRMGEDPKRVFCVGSPAIDTIKETALLDREELCRELGIRQDRRIGVLTYHPVTLDPARSSAAQVSNLLSAIRSRKDIHWVITYPNADTGNCAVMRSMKEFAENHPNICSLYISLGRVKYLSLLKHAAIMAGNSSSGIIEAPSFCLPVVNIGDRQKGRMMGRNVIDVKSCTKKNIKKAIGRACSRGFAVSLSGMKNPYGNGCASGRITAILKNINITGNIIKKRFAR